MNLINYGDGVTHTLAKVVSEISRQEKLFFEYFKDVPEYWKSKRFPYYDIHFRANEHYIQSYWKAVAKLFQQKKISIILIQQDNKPIGFIIFSHQGSYAILYKSPLFINRQNSRGLYGEAHFLVSEIIHSYYPQITHFILFITKSSEQKDELDILSQEALYHDERLRFMQEGLKLNKWKIAQECPIEPVKDLIKIANGAYMDTLNNNILYDVYTKSIR